MSKEFLYIPDNKKQEYFENNSPRKLPIGDIGCIHCGKKINPLEYKVELVVLPPPSAKEIKNRKIMFTDWEYSSEPKEFICCPNAPECDGTVMDWIPFELINKHDFF